VAALIGQRHQETAGIHIYHATAYVATQVDILHKIANSACVLHLHLYNGEPSARAIERPNTQLTAPRTTSNTSISPIDYLHIQLYFGFASQSRPQPAVWHEAV
jgi:hypothetical protein